MPSNTQAAHAQPTTQLVAHFYGVRPCGLGYALIVLSNKGVCRVELESSPEMLRDSVQSRYPTASECDQNSGPASQRHLDLVSKVVNHINESRAVDDLFPLDLAGSPFQKEVWQAMRKIRFGSTTTYQRLAVAIGRPTSVRAVANACGANPVAVLIPCHRVLRSDGGLGGFRWGIERKRALLEIEGSWPSVDQPLFETMRSS